MATIEQQIEALEFEREGYVTFGKDDRVKDVDEQLAYWRAELEKHHDSPPTTDAFEGVITEAEAATENPSTTGEETANALAALHAADTPHDLGDTIVNEADVAQEPTDQGEKAANDLSDMHRAEPNADPLDGQVVTEAEVIAENPHPGADDAPPARPSRSASTEDWRDYARDAGLDVADDASRDEIIAAYVDANAPGGNASKAAWAKYASDHGVDADGTRDKIRDRVIDAGWAPAAS